MVKFFLKLFRNSSYNIFFVFVALYLAIFYYSITSHTKNIFKKYNQHFMLVEREANEVFLNIQYLMEGLTRILSREEIYFNDTYTDSLVRSFNPKHQNNFDIASLTVDLILIDVLGNVKVNTSDTKADLSKALKSKFIRCLDESENNPFKLKASPIRKAQSNFKTSELIIPLNMTFFNQKRKKLGVLCSGIKLDSFNSKLNSLNSQHEWALRINIMNPPKEDAKFLSLESIKSISTLLKIFINNEDLVFLKAMKKYPFYLEIKISTDALVEDIKVNIIQYFSYLGITLFFIYLFLRNFKKSIQEPIFTAHKKLHLLVRALGRAPLSVVEDPNNLLLQQYDPNQFCIDVDRLIQHCYSLEINDCNQFLKSSSNEVKNKVLATLLREEAFYPFIKKEVQDQEELYLSKILKLLNEEDQEVDLQEFLLFAQAYCVDFYPQLKYAGIDHDQASGKITCKKNILLETIFLIVTFLIKDKCNFEESTISFFSKASSKNPEKFNIYIQMSDCVGMASALDWYSGPSYVYTGILPIMVLAVKNNFFFKIEYENNKVSAILEYID